MAVTGSPLPVPEALVGGLLGGHQLRFVSEAVGGGTLGLRSSSWRVGSSGDFLDDVANDMAGLLLVPVAFDRAEVGEDVVVCKPPLVKGDRCRIELSHELFLNITYDDDKGSL